MRTRLRNEDLPILAELGDDLAAGFRRQERVEASRRNRRRLRNVAVATAALFVVVPGAVATRYIWAPEPGTPVGGAFESSRAIQIADGRGDVLSWRLSAGVTEREGLCWQLAAFDTTDIHARGSSCDGRSLGQPLGMASLSLAGESLVYGWLDPAVARVRVDPGNGGVPADAQIVVAPADRVEKAGLPAGAKAYVASFAGSLDAPPTATAFDASGREIGLLPPKR